MIAASAPGKLILMGEHGAVYGLPALVTAVDLRVRVELTAGRGEGVELQLPDVGVRRRCGWLEIAGRAEEARSRWQGFVDGAPFVREADPAAVVQVALGEALAAAGASTLPPLALRVRSELPVGAGFGSSAAVAVAVIAGFLAWREVEPGEGLVGRLALEVERRQHGSPSGVDHGTVLRGGVQWAERETGGDLRLRPVVARPGLLAALRVYDSGAPAESTGTVVAAVAERRRGDPAAFDAVLSRMRDATNRFRAALEAGDEGMVGPAVRRFQRCLEEIGVVPEPVRLAVRRLEEAGCAAKISGAGALSGDAAGCLLVHPASARAGLPAPAGWRRIQCAMGGPGLELEAA